jgi:hypothetical protein
MQQLQHIPLGQLRGMSVALLLGSSVLRPREVYCFSFPADMDQPGGARFTPCKLVCLPYSWRQRARLALFAGALYSMSAEKQVSAARQLPPPQPSTISHLSTTTYAAYHVCCLQERRLPLRGRCLLLLVSCCARWSWSTRPLRSGTAHQVGMRSASTWVTWRLTWCLCFDNFTLLQGMQMS